ncbi:DUF6531 domain-containing protein [Paraburkholderia sp. BCC1884]|uniref:DUF6531 domain-containing protein n=1 Tax=Paraburkholderia sp. BCC1884 TaxID=2562668 RepID=UPI0011838CFE|nr:DUF6531 domain-containing protein [Paraburkholderia sp. BCC1884]
MKARIVHRPSTDSVVRRFVVSCFLLIGVHANAADYGQCMQIYQRSLGVPGTPSCAIQVAGTSPMSRGAGDPFGSMNYSNCPNALDWIKDYCAGAPVPPSPEGSCPVADPVLPAEGMVTLFETDFANGDALPLAFGRTYLSRPYDTTQTAMGRNWVNNWQRRIDLSAVNASAPQLTVYRGNQQPLTFNWNGKAWTLLGNRGLSLTKAADGYYYLKDELLGTTEAYAVSTGELYSETTRTGMLRKFLFDFRNRMVQINETAVDNITFNRFKVGLEYDDSDRIVAMTDPLGNVTRYRYDAKGNLASVTHPDASIRQYLYEDSRFPNALTGVKDESGSRIATWTYDANARVTSVTHPDTKRNASFSYASGKTTLSSPYGTSTFSFSFPDAWRAGSIVTPDGTVSRQWDSAGNLTQRTTPEGTTQYTWDSANRPTKATATIGGNRTVTTIEYADASSLRPHLVATPGRIRAFVYDANGNVTGYADQESTDATGELGMQAPRAGNVMTVGARYDAADRLIAATISRNGAKTEDWTYTYDARGNIATTTDAVSGWSMRTLERDAANRATVMAGNTGQATIGYDDRGRAMAFQYDERAAVANGGLARKLLVRYGYALDGTLSTRTATVATNGGAAQAISDAELGVWLTNWELGNDPVAPTANLTGLKSDADGFVPKLCVECYLTWKAKLTWKLFSGELEAAYGKSGDAMELVLSDQSQIPYPTLVPDSTRAAKTLLLYTGVFGAEGDGGAMVKCGGREDHENQCFQQYDAHIEMCGFIAPKMGGARAVALCKQRAFQIYQTCRGF